MLERSDFEDARISQVVVPIDFKLPQLFGFELIYLLNSLVLWLQNENEWSYLIRIKYNWFLTNSPSFLILIQINEIKLIGFPAFKQKWLREHFVHAHISDFHLENILIASQRNMLGNFKGQHRFKLILFNLISCHFFPKEIDLSISRGQLVRVNILIIASKFI